MKIDPYNNKEKWVNWKEKNGCQIRGIAKPSSNIVLRYLKDMEMGMNTSMVSKKGSRSPTRLNTLKNRLIFVIKHLENLYGIDNIEKITEQQICNFFSKMRCGEIKKRDGMIYKSIRDYVKVFKAFWHWYQLINKKEGKEIYDITFYLDTSQDKPEWVYLTENQIKLLYEESIPRYKPIIMFLFDTGIRAPTELINIKVSDLYNDCKELMIRDEISKTFGRRIKLMLCSDIIKDHIKKNNLSPDDYLFDITPKLVNRYLKGLAKRVLGDEKSLAGQKYSQLSMYDFRHCSCCYWLPRYKSESALKYRFGWKKSDKIHYYSELLGMKDTISEEDLLMDVTKTEIEKRLIKSENKNEILETQVGVMKKQLDEINIHVEKVYKYFQEAIRLEIMKTC
jgi:integrase